MSDESTYERPLTRRQLLHGALVGGAAVGVGGLLSACGGSISLAVLLPPPIYPIKPGGSLRVGATGGGAKDVIDAHLPTADTDIMRNWNLYESLESRPADFGPIEMLVASSSSASWPRRAGKQGARCCSAPRPRGCGPRCWRRTW